MGLKKVRQQVFSAMLKKKREDIECEKIANSFAKPIC
jgi:hypothetical protein